MPLLGLRGEPKQTRTDAAVQDEQALGMDMNAPNRHDQPATITVNPSGKSFLGTSLSSERSF
jgi:hypothetical protein